MDVTFVNPFIKATFNVLQTMASITPETGKPYLKKDKVAMGDITGLIGLTGDAKGTISVTFTTGSILSIVSKMFGEEVQEMNAEIQDAVGEISNMISGQARQELEGMGRSLKAAIPSVIVGKNHTITHITNDPIVAIPFKIESGDFTIEICFEE